MLMYQRFVSTRAAGQGDTLTDVAGEEPEAVVRGEANARGGGRLADVAGEELEVVVGDEADVIGDCGDEDGFALAEGEFFTVYLQGAAAFQAHDGEEGIYL